MKTRAAFIYTPTPSKNRRATGSFWRGHKLHAAIIVNYNDERVVAYRAKDHAPVRFYGVEKYAASRTCRADGDLMDDKWFFGRVGEWYYISDRLVDEVDLESARIKKEGCPTRRLKRTI